MPALPGYSITETLEEGGRTVVYRGRRQSDGRAVIVKMPASEHPAPRGLERLKHEYEIGRRLEGTRVARPLALETFHGVPALVMEDSGGRSLDRILGAPLEFGRFLALAVRMAAALADVHRQNVVHKDVKPRNILVDAATGDVRIGDFGIASLLPREPQATGSPSLIEGTLAYMSPEQTGRMNRAVDYRTDLYSLGVTFYEMLAGRLPFEARDPLGWVHCHIAVTPPPPSRLVPAIPGPVSDIVVKLLAKLAEDRYQSALGLERDLARCLARYEATGGVEPFPLGERDLSDRFQIPQKLYGREAEVASLLAAFDGVVRDGAPALLLVSGYSGVGKSSLVHEIHKPVVRERGFFASGKFDQYRRDVPYSTAVQALRELVQQLLAESEEALLPWKKRLEEALGVNARLIVDLVREVELIVGSPPPLPELPPAEAEARFQEVLRRFLGVFSSGEHPLALFLDDLQWADPASLKLLRHVVTHPETRNLLVVGAYRDNEVSPSHPLMLALDEIRRAGARVHDLVLSPLGLEDLGALVADTLHRERAETLPLARLVHERTQGNPFFASQFLAALHQEGLVAFDAREAAWRWDLAGIEAKGFTDNVVDLMVGKLRRLPEETRRALTLAACAGNAVELETLAVIADQSREEVRRDLWAAFREGLALEAKGACRFLHDRVQQAAYSLIPEGERRAVHLRIGRLLLAHTPPEALEERVFDIVGQLDLGASLISSPEERTALAALDLRAGRRAKRSGAYRSALTFLSAGGALLPPDGWEARYDLAWALHFERAECAFLSGEFADAERLLTTLVERARTPSDRADVHRLKVDLHVTRGQIPQAVGSALECLRTFGVDMPLHPSREEVEREYERFWSALGSRRVEDLIDLPPMMDPDARAAMRVLAVLAPPTFYTDWNLYCLHLCHQVNLTLKHGYTDASPWAYGLFGMLLGPAFHRFKDAYSFTQLGHDLMERRGFLGLRTKVKFAAALTAFWTRPIGLAIDHLKAAFQAGVETGDLTFACYCCNNLVALLRMRGDPLDEVFRECERRLDFVTRAKFAFVAAIIAVEQRFNLNMRGLTASFSTFADARLGPDDLEARFEEAGIPSMALWYRVATLHARYLSGDYDVALAAIPKIEKHLDAARGHPPYAEYRTFAALALAATYPPATEEARRESLAMMATCEEELREWAESCPETFADKHALVSAEIARVQGDDAKAMRLYERAIRAARDGGFVQHEAIAREVAARFYLERGIETVAATYLREARQGYVRWGADGKARQLDRLYPGLLAPPREPSAVTATFTSRTADLDLMAVIKASQTISSDIVLPRLIETLLRIVVEHAGARRGCLILARGESGDDLSLEAEAAVGEDVEIRLARSPLSASSVVPLSMVNYVKRTREPVILGDAAAGSAFSRDEYLARARPKSALCLPILRQAKLTGLLYLENDLAAGAFTPGRLAVLELLASQAAVSLENASLYADLARENAERLRADEALRASQGQLRAMIDNSAAVIYVKDREGRYILVNRQYERLFHVTWDEVAGKTDHDLFPKETADQFRAHDLRVLDAGTALEFDEVAPLDDGVHAYISIKFPLVDAAGVRYAVCGMSTDITERKRAELERERLNRALEAKNADLESLLYTISHDMRAPLVNLQGFGGELTRACGTIHDALAGGEVPEAVRLRLAPALDVDVPEALHFIVRAAGRMDVLLNGALRFFRLDRAAVRPEPLEMNALLAGVLETLRFQAREAGAAIHVADLPPCVGDAAQVHQVFSNLLDNALKYRAPGRPCAIRVSGERDGTEAVYCVEDNGTGVAPEHREAVFRLFHRLDPRSPTPGDGVGLTIAKRIVERHGGRIWIESVAGEGARFRVALPAAPATGG